MTGIILRISFLVFPVLAFFLGCLLFKGIPLTAMSGAFVVFISMVLVATVQMLPWLVLACKYGKRSLSDMKKALILPVIVNLLLPEVATVVMRNLLGISSSWSMQQLFESGEGLRFVLVFNISGLISLVIFYYEFKQYLKTSSQPQPSPTAPQDETSTKA